MFTLRTNSFSGSVIVHELYLVLLYSEESDARRLTRTDQDEDVIQRRVYTP